MSLQLWTELFDESSINIVQLDNGELWFQLSHVCKLLGHSNPTVALQSHTDDDERKQFDIGKHELVNFVSESGLYGLILGSQKPEAKSFKRWLRKEILPKLRKMSFDVPLNNESHLLKEKLKTVKKIENCFKGIANLQNKLQAFQLDSPKLFKVVSSDYQQLDVKPLVQLQSKEPSENDLKASLIANRLGLAFNKQIKAFEALQSTLSPDAYNLLREEFNQLQKDNQELVKLKTPQVVVEKVYDPSTNQELLSKNKKLLVENENLKVNLQMLQNELSAKENVLSNLKNALDEMQNMTRRKMNAVSNIGETVSSLSKKV